MELETYVKNLEDVNWTEKVSYEDTASTHFVRELSDAVNCFSFDKQALADAILQNKNACQNFIVLSSACAISMGYEYLCAEKRGIGHWDQRNIASQKYFYLHLEALKKVFAQTAGFEMPFREECSYEGFYSDCKLTHRTALKLELMDFGQTHKTLQQSMAGVFVKVLGTVSVEIASDQHFMLI